MPGCRQPGAALLAAAPSPRFAMRTTSAMCTSYARSQLEMHVGLVAALCVISAGLGVGGFFDPAHSLLMLALCAVQLAVLLILRHTFPPARAGELEAVIAAGICLVYALVRLETLAASTDALAFARAAAADLEGAGSSVSSARILVGFYAGTMAVRPSVHLLYLALIHAAFALPPVVAWAWTGDTSWLSRVSTLIVLPSIGGSCLGLLQKRSLTSSSSEPPPPTVQTVEQPVPKPSPAVEAAGVWAGKAGMDLLVQGVISAFHGFLWRVGKGSGHAVAAAAFAILVAARVGLQAMEVTEAHRRVLFTRTVHFVMFSIPATFFLTGSEILVSSEGELIFFVVMFGLHACVMALSGSTHLRLPVGIAELLAIPFFVPMPGTGLAASTLHLLLATSTIIGQFLSAAVNRWFVTAVSAMVLTDPYQRVLGDSDSGAPPKDSERARALLRMCEQLRSGAARLVDVREEWEHASSGVLTGAMLYPLSVITRGDPAPAALAAPDTVAYLYCARGIRVHTAKELLVKMAPYRDAAERQQLVALPEGFNTLVEFGRSQGGIAADVLAVDHPVAAPAERLPPEDARLLLQALQTSRDYADYHETRLLGRGSSGAAVLLRHPSGQMVVAKRIRVDAQLADASLSKIQEEVLLLKQLRHRHVIGYLGTLFSSGVVHILMEYAPGGTMTEQLMSAKANAAPFGEARIRRWARELADGLQSIHGHGVLHRDLKPDNMLLGPMDDVKIADFGWSTVLDGASRLATTFAGTPYYMAPEVLQRQPYGVAADVWSAGVVLYELLALTRPFEASSLEDLEVQVHCRDVGLEPHLSRSGHSPELCALATSGCLLRHSVAQRMTLAELVAALEELPHVTDSEPPHAPSVAAPHAPSVAADEGKAFEEMVDVAQIGVILSPEAQLRQGQTQLPPTPRGHERVAGVRRGKRVSET